MDEQIEKNKVKWLIETEIDRIKERDNVDKYEIIVELKKILTEIDTSWLDNSKGEFGEELEEDKSATKKRTDYMESVIKDRDNIEELKEIIRILNREIIELSAFITTYKIALSDYYKCDTMKKKEFFCNVNNMIKQDEVFYRWRED